jgi:hypothetical protein
MKGVFLLHFAVLECALRGLLNRIDPNNCCIEQLLKILPMIFCEEAGVEWNDEIARHVEDSLSFIDLSILVPFNKRNPLPEFKRVSTFRLICCSV